MASYNMANFEPKAQGSGSWPTYLQEQTVLSAAQGRDVPFLSPDVMQRLQSLIAPYQQSMLNQYNQGFSNQFGSQMGQAGTQAGQLAAYRGYNPASYIGNAQSKVRQDLMPGYFQGLGGLNQDFLGQLLNLGQNASQFQRQGWMGLSDAFARAGGMDVGSRGVSAQNPTGLDYFAQILGGAAQGAGGAFGTALAGG